MRVREFKQLAHLLQQRLELLVVNRHDTQSKDLLDLLRRLELGPATILA